MFLAVAGGVFVYNQRRDAQIVFPLLDRITPSPYAQGELTVAILAGLGVATLAFAIFGMIRERRSADEE
ncbi:MAG: hypothetical protein H6737_08530 [Alphaproteobacteria bacterium]|nr:hypothetical protein [Alphaproteobacteria bacterium]